MASPESLPSQTELNYSQGIIDPSLAAGAIAPASHVSPIVERFLEHPESLDSEELKAGYQAAEQTAGFDGMKHKVVVESGGTKYWGSEYPNLFTFDGTLRGNFENFEEPTEENGNSIQIAVQAMKGAGGMTTHAFFETDDGHMYAIRRTKDTLETKSASEQEFEIISTTAHLGREGNDVVIRKVSSEQLKGIFVRPGEPLVLGIDPETGKQLKTRGAVTKITAMSRRDEKAVDPRHPKINQPEVQRSTPGEFMEAVRIARTMEAASKVGPLAVVDHFPVSREAEIEVSEVRVPGEPAVSERASSYSNPYEQFDDTQLEQVRDNIVDSLQEGARQFDLGEMQRAAKNLYRIQREFESRNPEMTPEHERGEVIGAVTYTTEIPQVIIDKIGTHLLDNVDGASARTAKAENVSEELYINSTDVGEKLDYLELGVLFHAIGKSMRVENGARHPEASDPNIIAMENPYSNLTNDELRDRIQKLKDAVTDAIDKGDDKIATDFKQRLTLAGQAYKARQ